MCIVYKLGYMGTKDFAIEKAEKWDFLQSRADEMGMIITEMGRAKTEGEAQEMVIKLKSK